MSVEHQDSCGIDIWAGLLVLEKKRKHEFKDEWR